MKTQKYYNFLINEEENITYLTVGRCSPTGGKLPDQGDFSFCYKGTRFEDLAPVTLSFHITEFTFADKKGNTQLIEISAGQLPPQPFVIKASGLTILTFHSKEEKRLYPDFFQVVAALT